MPSDEKEIKPPLTEDNWEPDVGLNGDAERQEERQFLRQHKDCFAFGLHDLGVLKGEEVRIDLTDDAPIFRKPYRHSDAEKKLIQARTKELWDAGLIELSNGEYASATVMPSKKDIYGNWTEKRMCGDYRPLNNRTKSDMYAMPTPEEIFNAVGHAKVFSTLDLRSGYHQLLIRERDKQKTAFWGIDEFGKDRLYKWKFLPFGLKNAPAEFQRVMDRVLAGLVFTKCYIDDILTFSRNRKQHREHLRQVLERLIQHGLKLHPGKCRFFYSQVEYLGHMIYPGGIGVMNSKIEALNGIPRPRDVSWLRAFLRLANYYRKFVQSFSKIAKPLTSLTRTDQDWIWGDEQEAAFLELKSRLASAPILRRPIPGRPYQLHTDWSTLGIGAVLTQMDDEGQEFVVAYASRSNNNAEAQYSSYEGECLAVVWAIAHFRCYLYGSEFLLVTDHQPLRWLMESDKLTGKLAQWALMLQEYDFKVVHRAGLVNMDADGLSRNPCPSQKDATGARWHVSEDEEKIPSWHAACLSLLAYRGDVPSHSSDKREGEEESGGVMDIHHDGPVWSYLRDSVHPAGITPKERDRITQRAKRFAWEGTQLLRVFSYGRRKVVPKPPERERLTQQVHVELGHFGVRRTHSLLQTQYWWVGMQGQVQQTVARCRVCDRVRASFNAPTLILQPLPIMGLGYRWGVDFAGPIPITKRHNKYVLVMIEHFSKWVELVALPDKSSEGAAYALLDRILSRFGAPAEVLTDQGREFQGEFQALCEQAFIDHRTTSRDHPEADGLAERMVQIVKRGLRKYGVHKGHHQDWDTQLPWLAMGYCFSKQASLATFSPYFLLYGREPVIPGTIRREVQTVVNLDDPTTWIQVCEARAKLFRQAMPMAFDNLAIAQHRDTLRYATIRGRGYRPQLRRFAKGDYVYLQQTAPTTLDITAGRIILRVRRVLGSGVLELEGRDGRTWKDHARNCAPCHLPHIDGRIDTTIGSIPAGLRCMLCGRAQGATTMILCDQCSTGWHTQCLSPPLPHIPEDTWRCPRCTGAPAS